MQKPASAKFNRLGALVLAFVLALTSLAVAQPTGDIPPLPRPRPDRTATPADETQATPAGNPATEAIANLTSTPQPVTLSAQITAEGATIPDGLVWRVFDATPDASGEMVLVAKHEGGTAAMDLPPGDYFVHLSYGRAQLSEAVNVSVGPNEFVMDLEAGALRLNSAVTGDIPISPAQLHFDIFTAGSDTSRVLVGEKLPANEIVTLNSGTYHVVSYFGPINAVVRADLRVEPGQLTDATLYHHASVVSFKLVSETGGEAIADVEWTLKTTDGATIFTERGAFPSTVLAEGEYLILGKLGDKVYNREIEIRPGNPQEVEVLTAIY